MKAFFDITAYVVALGKFFFDKYMFFTFNRQLLSNKTAQKLKLLQKTAPYLCRPAPFEKAIICADCHIIAIK